MEPVSIGKSSDSVFRLVSDDSAVSYLKVGGKYVKQEYERLQWLQERVPVAKILAFEEREGLNRLTTSAMPGVMAHQCDGSQREEVVKSIARSLRRLHETPIGDCPFDNTIDNQLAEATANTEAGIVDESDFDPLHIGMTARELLPVLLAAKPTTFENVLTHGDHCLPNIFIDPQSLEVTGYIDLGRFGISDRYQDLGITLNTLDHNFGPGYDDIFFEAYGIQGVDQLRIAFYQMLDEFF
jgi:aminoglycoside 3'-phosphotransferase II